MEALLFICHGSRLKSAQEQAVGFVKKCMENSTVPIKEYCFLELASPSIEEAFVRCINQGADTIIAIPVLLLTAAHAKVDIPNELERLSLRFPEVTVKYGNTIGVHEKMVDTLIEKIEETGEEFENDSIVLLVGRGSSDPDVKSDLNAIADMFKSRTGVKSVQTCFLAAATPTLEEGLKVAGDSKSSKVFIIPYLLFTGILMNHIRKVMKQHSDSKNFVLCNYLGYHPNIEKVIDERIKEAAELY